MLGIDGDGKSLLSADGGGASLDAEADLGADGDGNSLDWSDRIIFKYFGNPSLDGNSVLKDADESQQLLGPEGGGNSLQGLEEESQQLLDPDGDGDNKSDIVDSPCVDPLADVWESAAEHLAKSNELIIDEMRALWDRPRPAGAALDNDFDPTSILSASADGERPAKAPRLSIYATPSPLRHRGVSQLDEAELEAQLE